MTVKTPKLKVREVPPIKAYMVSMTPKPKPLPVIEKSSGQHAEVPLSEKPATPEALTATKNRPQTRLEEYSKATTKYIPIHTQSVTCFSAIAAYHSPK